MDNFPSVRRGWLRVMYFYTLFGAGGFGLGDALFPGCRSGHARISGAGSGCLQALREFPFSVGVGGDTRAPLPSQFVPLLLLQLIYKPIWLMLVALPLFLEGQFPLYVVMIAAIFLTYIIGDLIAIPFRDLVTKERNAFAGSLCRGGKMACLSGFAASLMTIPRRRINS